MNTCPVGIESAYDVKDAMVFGYSDCVTKSFTRDSNLFIL